MDSAQHQEDRTVCPECPLQTWAAIASVDNQEAERHIRRDQTRLLASQARGLSNAGQFANLQKALRRIGHDDEARGVAMFVHHLLSVLEDATKENAA